MWEINKLKKQNLYRKKTATKKRNITTENERKYREKNEIKKLFKKAK